MSGSDSDRSRIHCVWLQPIPSFLKYPLNIPAVLSLVTCSASCLSCLRIANIPTFCLYLDWSFVCRACRNTPECVGSLGRHRPFSRAPHVPQPAVANTPTGQEMLIAHYLSGSRLVTVRHADGWRMRWRWHLMESRRSEHCGPMLIITSVDMIPLTLWHSP